MNFLVLVGRIQSIGKISFSKSNIKFISLTIIEQKDAFNVIFFGENCEKVSKFLPGEWVCIKGSIKNKVNTENQLWISGGTIEIVGIDI